MVVEDWEKARDWLRQKSLTRISAKVEGNQNDNAMIDKHTSTIKITNYRLPVNIGSPKFLLFNGFH